MGSKKIKKARSVRHKTKSSKIYAERESKFDISLMANSYWYFSPNIAYNF